MRTTSEVHTADQLAHMPSDGNRYELVEGVLNMMSPAGFRHGRITARINKLLAIHVDDNDLGATFAAETGCRLARNPDTVRAADAAFVAHEKLHELQDDSGFLPFAPDLAVEVVSPNDTFADVEKKAFTWLEAGTRLVLLVDPASETVHAYRSRASIVVLTSNDVLDASDAVPGWKVRVAEFFP
jgi:Uma2 family endonuclease